MEAVSTTVPTHISHIDAAAGQDIHCTQITGHAMVSNLMNSIHHDCVLTNQYILQILMSAVQTTVTVGSCAPTRRGRDSVAAGLGSY